MTGWKAPGILRLKSSDRIIELYFGESWWRRHLSTCSCVPTSFPLCSGFVLVFAAKKAAGRFGSLYFFQYGRCCPLPVLPLHVSFQHLSFKASVRCQSFPVLLSRLSKVFSVQHCCSSEVLVFINSSFNWLCSAVFSGLGFCSMLCLAFDNFKWCASFLLQYGL